MRKKNIIIALILSVTLVFSQAIPVSAAVNVKAPKLVSAGSINDDYIQLKWGKVQKVGGYKIYRAETERGKYKSIASMKPTVTKFNDKKIEENQKYYYKIRAWKKVDGKIKYSAYSNVQSAIVRVNSLDFNQLMNEQTKNILK